MDDEFQYRYDLMKQEIDTLQNGIRTYDGMLFTIKGWAITIFSAFIFFAADKQQPAFLPFCAISVILFWLLDATYRTIQTVYINRYNEIERFLQGSEFSHAVKERNFKNFHIPNVGASFKVTGFKKYIGIFKIAFVYHNALLYVAMLILIALLKLVIK
jgi:hypothetical protein